MQKGEATNRVRTSSRSHGTETRRRHLSNLVSWWAPQEGANEARLGRRIEVVDIVVDSGKSLVPDVERRQVRAARLEKRCLASEISFALARKRLRNSQSTR